MMRKTITARENLAQLLLEDAMAGYWDWDIPANKVYLSPRFRAILGHEQAELSTDPGIWRKIMVADDYDIVMEKYEQHVSSGGKIPHRGEARYYHRDGSVVWVNFSGRVIEWDEQGQPLRMIGCNIDITEQKQNEELLTTSERRFKGAFEYSAIGMALVSTEGKLLKVNQNLCNMLGYNEATLTQKGFQELTHPEDLEKDLQLLHSLLRGEIPYYQMEKRYFHKNNQTIWARLSVSLVRSKEGQPLHFVSQIEDISAQKSAQRKLKNTLEIVQEQNDRLMNFAHIVTHNLKSNAGNLALMLNYYRKEQDAEAKAEYLEYLQLISNSFNETIEHLTEIVDTQTRAQDQLEKVNLHTWVNKTMAALSADLEKLEGVVHNEVDPRLQVEYNPAYLDSILMNLMTNALKYRHPDRVPEITISNRQNGEFTILDIKDNGLGMDLDRVRPKLFSLYKTFHGNKDAKGVGLFITKNQVETMGGKLEVESEPGKGSTFSLYLRK